MDPTSSETYFSEGIFALEFELSTQKTQTQLYCWKKNKLDKTEKTNKQSKQNKTKQNKIPGKNHLVSI